MESQCEFICHRVTGRRHKGLGRSQQSRDQHVQEGSRRRGSVLRHLLQEFKGQQRSNIQGEKKKMFSCFPWIFQTLYITVFLKCFKWMTCLLYALCILIYLKSVSVYFVFGEGLLGQTVGVVNQQVPHCIHGGRDDRKDAAWGTGRV